MNRPFILPASILLSPLLVLIFGCFMTLYLFGQVAGPIIVSAAICALPMLGCSIYFCFCNILTVRRMVLLGLSLIASCIGSAGYFGYLVFMIGGKPGTIFYTGPEQEYHYFSVFFSIASLILLVVGFTIKSDVEVILESRIKNSTVKAAIFTFSVALVLISVFIWYEFLTLSKPIII